MRLTFNAGSRLRKMAVALTALCAAGLAGAAYAQGANGGVIVASSSPGYAVGRVVEIGHSLRLEPGASVTILEESGRVSTIARSGVFRPAEAPRARGARTIGPSMVDSVSALVGSDRTVRTPGGVRSLEDQRQCNAGPIDASAAGLQRALDAHCDAQAAAIIERLVEAAGPPQLYVSLLQSREARGRTIGIAVQANFDAYLYCRVRRTDSSLSAVTPEPNALPMRVLASRPYDFVFSASETAGAVQCVAIGARPDAPAPDVGDWPRELDPERAEANARVASVLLPINP